MSTFNGHMILSSLKFDPMPKLKRAFDDFQFLCRFNRGRFGNIYKARDKVTNRNVVLSQFNFPIWDKAFNKHGNSLAIFRLKHENIEAFEGFILNGPGCFYVISAFTDVTLESMLNQKSAELTKSEIQIITMNLLSGANYLHQNNFTHGKLTPSRVIFHPGYNLRISLVDSGFCGDGFCPKCLPYTSPEQITKSWPLLHYVDVWAIGCIFAELQLRKPLFPVRSEMELLKMSLNMFGNSSDLIIGTQKATIVIPNVFKTSLLTDMEFCMNRDELNILKDMLVVNPGFRPSATTILRMSYFRRHDLSSQ